MSQEPDLIERLNKRAETMNGCQPVGAGDGGTYVVGYYGVADAKLDREAATALAEKDARIAALKAAVAVQRESKEYAQRCCITAESALTASRAECEGLRALMRNAHAVMRECGWQLAVGCEPNGDGVLEAACTEIEADFAAALSQKETGA